MRGSPLAVSVTYGAHPGHRGTQGAAAATCDAQRVPGQCRGGERRDSARLRNSYFSCCLDKPVTSDTSVCSGQAPPQAAGWHTAKPGLEVPRWQAERQVGLGVRFSPAAFPRAHGCVRSNPTLGSAPCLHPASSISRKDQQLPTSWACTDPQVA